MQTLKKILWFLGYLMELTVSILVTWPINTLFWSECFGSDRKNTKRKSHILGLVGIGSLGAGIGIPLVLWATTGSARLNGKISIVWLVNMVVYLLAFDRYFVFTKKIDRLLDEESEVSRPFFKGVLDRVRWLHSPFRRVNDFDFH